MALDIADGRADPPAYRGQCRAEAALSGAGPHVPVAASIRAAPPGVFPPWGIATRVDPAEPTVPVVVAVTRDSPMDKAGIRLDDRLMEIAGHPATGHQPALERLRGAGRTIDLVVERDGRLFELDIRR